MTFQAREMTKSDAAIRKTSRKLTRKDLKIQAAMAKAILEVKRDADARNITLAVASKNAWLEPG